MRTASAEVSDRPQAAAPAAPERSRLQIAPTAGGPGTEVTLQIDGLAGNTLFAVGFGALSSGYRVVDEARSNEMGEIDHVVRVPEELDSADPHYFFLLDEGQQRPIAVSDAFEIQLP